MQEIWKRNNTVVVVSKDLFVMSSSPLFPVTAFDKLSDETTFFIIIGFAKDRPFPFLGRGALKPVDLRENGHYSRESDESNV